LMWQNIAEQVEVTVDFTFKPQWRTSLSIAYDHL
jgi:hypothetical protein